MRFNIVLQPITVMIDDQEVERNTDRLWALLQNKLIAELQAHADTDKIHPAITGLNLGKVAEATLLRILQGE